MRLNKRMVATAVSILLLMSTSVLVAAQEPVIFAVHGSTGAVEAYRALLARFTEETGIPAEVLHTGDSAIAGKWEEIFVLTAAGMSPDVVSGVSTEFGEYATTGIIEPLDAYIQRDNVDMGQLIPSFTEALQLNGQQYLLPYGSSALVWMYNPDHFEMAGMAQPPATWGESWTFEDLKDTARKLTRRDDNGNVEQWGIAGWPVAEWWQTIPYAFGGRWISDDLKTFLGAEEKSITALQTYADLAYVDGVMNNNGGQGGEPVIQGGRASMAALGTWTLPRMANADIDFDFMPWFKYGDEDPAGVLFPIGYGILSASKNKENAWELIKWLTWNEEANSDYSLAAGALPALFSNLTTWMDQQRAINGDHQRPEVIAEQVQNYNAVINIRKVPVFTQISPILQSTVQSVFNNQQDARTALMSVEGVIQQFINQGNQ